MSQNLHQSSATPYAPMLTFSWGVENVARYIRWTENVTLDGQEFVSAPELGVVFDKPLNAGVDDSPLTITIKGNRQPADTLALPYHHAPVRVIIEEVDPLRPDTRREVFFGKVSSCESSLRSNTLFCKLTVEGIKARLTHLLGLQALSTCIWPFGDENNSPCKVTLADKRVTGTIDARYVDGNPVRILAAFSEDYPDYDNFRWAGGYVSVDGNKIKIRESRGSGVFDLRSAIPPSWVGEEAIFTPGCDKTVAACRYWENEHRFMGFGIGMPGANPVFSQKR